MHSEGADAESQLARAQRAPDDPPEGIEGQSVNTTCGVDSTAKRATGRPACASTHIWYKRRGSHVHEWQRASSGHLRRVLRTPPPTLDPPVACSACAGTGQCGIDVWVVPFDSEGSTRESRRESRRESTRGWGWRSSAARGSAESKSIKSHNVLTTNLYPLIQPICYIMR